MRLGLHMAYWGIGPGPEEQVALVQEAERCGFDSVWAGEAYGSDVVSILGWLAGATTRIRLGTAVAQIPARPPTALAMAAATLDRISGGRVLLGVGPSGPQVAEGWYGQRFAPQIPRTRDYMTVLRSALARETVSYKGPTLEMPLPDGIGKPLHLMIYPVQERIPIYLAAMGPKATALAGEMADGWMPLFFAPEHVAAARKHLDEGCARAGRDPGAVAIVPTVYTAINDDRDAARDAVREPIALYIGGMGSRDKNFYNELACRYGFEEAARRVQDLYLAGRKREAAAALPDELVDLVALCGPPDVVRDRLAAFRDAGVHTLLASIMADSALDRLRQVRALAEANAA